MTDQSLAAPVAAPNDPTPTDPTPDVVMPADQARGESAPAAARARRRARRAARRTRRPSSLPVPPIERFAIILGAMKCGTTSLYDHLVAHPEVARCRVKEPNFFSATAEWRKGPDHYRRLWADFDPARHRLALEASANYTKVPRFAAAAARIRDFDAPMDFLYVLRDPVDRIESHVAHNIAKGRVDAAGHAAMLPMALDVSRYAFQLDYLQTALGEVPLLIDFDALRDRPAEVLRRCAERLGIDPDFAFPPRPPSNVRRAKNGAEAFRLDPDTRRLLQAALHDDVARLRDAYGFDVSAWGFPETPALAPAVVAAAVREAAAGLPPIRPPAKRGERAAAPGRAAPAAGP